MYLIYLSNRTNYLLGREQGIDLIKANEYKEVRVAEVMLKVDKI